MLGKADLEKLLAIDHENEAISRNLFDKYEISALIQPTIDLFDALLEEVQTQLPRYAFPFARIDETGETVHAYDLFLRCYMTASAQQQFLFAMSHIYRGHASEAVGHIRRAIEGAGIAYLTVSKPEIAEYFQVSDMKKLRNATGTNTILPLDNPVTAPLNKSIEIASAMIHNNYISFASRLEPNIRQDGESWTFSATLYAHEGDLQTILNITLWTFRVMERIARLIAASFELNPCDWFTSLDSIRLQIDKLYVDLNQIVNPEST